MAKMMGQGMPAQMQARLGPGVGNNLAQLGQLLQSYQPQNAGLPQQNYLWKPPAAVAQPNLGAGWLPPRTAVPGQSPYSQVPGTRWGQAPPTMPATPTMPASGTPSAVPQYGNLLDYARANPSWYGITPVAGYGNG